MSATRTLMVLCLSLAMTAFLGGCDSDSGGGGGSAGEGGSAGTAGTGGDGGSGGMLSPIEEAFEVSLHNTRYGKDFWYSADQNGFESLTNAPIEGLTCIGCHAKSDTEWDGPGCDNCHGEGTGGTGGMAIPKHLDSATCLGCHGRQAAEGSRIQEEDFHSAMNCAACHGDRNPDPEIVDANDVHGTLGGVEYDTMLRPGAIAVRCTDCHTDGGPGTLPPDDGYHDPARHANVDCALCHTQTVLSCINCHLDDDWDNQQKCASAQITNWKFVMKWDKDGEDGDPVFHPGTLMTLKYNCDRDGDHPDCGGDAEDPKKTVAVFAPYYAHTVTPEAIESLSCGTCHANANCDAIEGANSVNRLKIIEFEGTGGAGGVGGPTGRLTNPISGIIPLPESYKDKFAVDFVEWQAGAGSGCPPMGEMKPMVLFETGPDLWQTGADTGAPNPEELGRPLNASEFETFCPPE